MSFVTKKIEKKLGVDLDGDGMIGGRRHGVPVGYNPHGQQSSGLINELEKATHIDLNRDGRIGGQPRYPANYQQFGGSPYPPTYNPYGGPPPPSNFQQPGDSLVNELEKATNIDLNHDGRIGGPPSYPANYQQFGGSPYPPTNNPYGGPPPPTNFQQPGGGSLINELEKATNIDLNRDGRIGGQPNYPANYQQFGGSAYPPTNNSYGGPAPPSNFQQPGDGLINELEKATNIDLNHDGRIGGPPSYPTNYQQFGGSAYPPTNNPYGGPPPPTNFQQPGGGTLFDELEKATNIDLNRDGRIGGQPNYPANYQQFGGSAYPPTNNSYGGPAPPSNFQQPGGGLINELEKATNIDLNRDGRIGSQPNYPANYQQFGGSAYPPTNNSYGGPPPPSNFQQPGGGLIKELEKATNIDLDGDGRIGGQPNFPPNYQQFGNSPYPSNYNSYSYNH